MAELEENMRKIILDGLVWGGSKLVAVGYGIKKLQVNVTVEDDKISIDDLQAQIETDEDHVQSTDVVSSTHTGEVTCRSRSIGCHAKAVEWESEFRTISWSTKYSRSRCIRRAMRDDLHENAQLKISTTCSLQTISCCDYQELVFH